MSADREALVHRVAAELDMPSVYMGGPSLPSRRKAERIVDLLPDYAGAMSALGKMVAVADLEATGDDVLEATWVAGEARKALRRLEGRS